MTSYHENSTNRQEITRAQVSKQCWGFSYQDLQLAQILPDCTLTRLLHQDGVIISSNLKAIVENQVGLVKTHMLTKQPKRIKAIMVPNNSMFNQVRALWIEKRHRETKYDEYLDNYVKRALWQVLIRWLSHIIRTKKIINKKAYSELLKILGGMKEEGVLEIDKLFFDLQRVATNKAHFDVESDFDSDSEEAFDSAHANEDSLSQQLAKFFIGSVIGFLTKIKVGRDFLLDYILIHKLSLVKEVFLNSISQIQMLPNKLKVLVA